MTTAESRAESRVRAMMSARLRGAGEERDAAILDISTRGVLVSTALPPERGQFVELVVGRNSLVGHVKWSSDRRFGMALRERVSVASLVSGDGGPVTLSKTNAARKRGGGAVDAVRSDASWFGRAMQFWLAAGVGIGVAVVTSNIVSKGMGALALAREAMAGG